MTDSTASPPPDANDPAPGTPPDPAPLAAGTPDAPPGAAAEDAAGSGAAERAAQEPTAVAKDAAAKGATENKGATEKKGKGKKPRHRKRPPRSHANEHLQKGVIQEIREADILVEFGPKVHGLIARDEFENLPAVGEEHEFTFENLKGDLWELSRKGAHIKEIWSTMTPGKRVQAKVIGENSGGLELKVGPVAAFLPSSHIDVVPVKDHSGFFGQTLECEVLEVNRKRRRLVVSRRAILQGVRDEQRKEALAHVKVGDVRDGTVVRLESYGAIVDLEQGLSGLLHVSNISHQRVKTPADVLKVGQPVKVRILELKDGGQRIGLGMKQLEEDPWRAFTRSHPVNSRLPGRITRCAEFGAFVELQAGVEGLLHISQLSPDRVAAVTDAVKPGQEVLVRIQSVDLERKRLSLSRLNGKGVLLGSDEDSEDDDEIVDPSFQEPPAQRGTNLGAILRQALEGK